MSTEPQFILHASDPASQGTLREYITIRKRQGATSLELERLHQQLLEFAGWIRSQTRPPVMQAVAPKKPITKDAVDASYAAMKDPVMEDIDAVRGHLDHGKPLPKGFKKKGGKR